MDRIGIIKYNKALLEQQVTLERQSAMVNEEVKNMQASCNHLNVVLGKDNKYFYKKCLFCEKTLIGQQDNVKEIDASLYKEELYGRGIEKSERIKRLEDLRNEVINILRSNPDISDDDLYESLKRKVKINKE